MAVQIEGAITSKEKRLDVQRLANEVTRARIRPEREGKSGISELRRQTNGMVRTIKTEKVGKLTAMAKACLPLRKATHF